MKAEKEKQTRSSCGKTNLVVPDPYQSDFKLLSSPIYRKSNPMKYLK